MGMEKGWQSMGKRLWSHCEGQEVSPEDVLDEEELRDYYSSRRDRIRHGSIKFVGRQVEKGDGDPWSL